MHGRKCEVNPLIYRYVVQIRGTGTMFWMMELTVYFSLLTIIKNNGSWMHNTKIYCFQFYFLIFTLQSRWTLMLRWKQLCSELYSLSWVIFVYQLTLNKIFIYKLCLSILLVFDLIFLFKQSGVWNYFLAI